MVRQAQDERVVEQAHHERIVIDERVLLLPQTSHKPGRLTKTLYITHSSAYI